jgi:hypothetical protein
MWQAMKMSTIRLMGTSWAIGIRQLVNVRVDTMWFCIQNAKKKIVYNTEPPMQQNRNPIAVARNCRETDETGPGISRLVCFCKAWIWSPFMIDETLMRSCNRSNSMTWLKWELYLRGSSNTALFLLKDLLEGYEIQWGAANDKILSSV